MKVVVVECREVVPVSLEEHRFETDLAHIAPDWPAAVLWMRAHPEYVSSVRLAKWWWVCHEAEISGDLMTNDVRFFDRMVREMPRQPVPAPVG